MIESYSALLLTALPLDVASMVPCAALWTKGLLIKERLGFADLRTLSDSTARLRVRERVLHTQPHSNAFYFLSNP